MTAEASLNPTGFFVLRTPLLPFSALMEWGDGLEAVDRDGDREELERALRRDRSRLRERLREALRQPELRDGLFLAAPGLEEALEAWEKDPEAGRGRSLEPVLVAYYSRAAARPTPFGLFAGATTGALGEVTRLRLGGRERYGRHSRLDMDYLWGLSQALQTDPALRGCFVYRPNSTLYDVGGRFRMAEARFTESDRSYHLVAIDPTPYLIATLQRAAQGATRHDLATALVDDDITMADAEEYVDELINSQILIADVQPPLTGQEPGTGLLAALRTHPETRQIADRLAAAEQELKAIDGRALGAVPADYASVVETLEGLPVMPRLSRLVQVDLTKPAAEATLGPNVVAEIVRGARLLQELAPPRPKDGLARFREEFVRRYETREVPLVEVLDEESGIGFERSDSPSADPSPLLANLALRGGSRPDGPRWTGRDAVLLPLVMDAVATGADEVVLDRHVVDALTDPSRTDLLPEAFEVMAALAAESDEAVARGDFRVLLHSVTGPPGARIVGRFCHVDADLHAAVRGHLRDEEACHPDRIYAEVVHLPEGRVGNILSRPVLRGYEIPYLGRSGAPEDRQIPVSDLLVSVVGDRIVLRSRRLGREVVPRLTTTHNYGWRSLGVYRFLCALQVQGVASDLMWDWGPLAQAPFLPRVVAGRLILARARWRLGPSDLAAFRDDDATGRFASVQQWRVRRRLPRWVALADGDNELVTDLDNVLGVEALTHQLRGRASAVLFEVLPGPDELSPSGPEGRFQHQLVVPFGRAVQRSDGVARPARTGGEFVRRFPPGSDWLYMKLYGGTAGADFVLDHVGGALDAAVTAGDADRWFYIRYSDPDPHLRVRAQGHPDRLQSTVRAQLEALAGELIQKRHLWRVQLDTYEREVERYGGEEGVELAERLFAADSRAALAIVRSLRGDAGADLRWRVALRGIDQLFDDLGLTLEDKRAVARAAREGYGREFGVGGAFRGQVGKRFRPERTALEALLSPGSPPPAALQAATAALADRSTAITGIQIGPVLRDLATRGALTTSVTDLALSYAHMHVNRVLRSAQRAQELVLFEFLDRLYASMAARRAGPGS